MDFEKKFFDIHNFLFDFKLLWQNEVLQSYPTSLDFYPSDWILQLENLDDQSLFQIDSFKDSSFLKKNSLSDFIKKIQTLVQLPQSPFNQNQTLPVQAFLKIKEKKKHEIQILNQKIQQLKLENKIEVLLDIGGGIGHLSRILAQYQNIETFCIEANSQFVKLGLNHLKQHPLAKDASQMHFINAHFPNISLLPTLMKKRTLMLGLHTCGPLAINQIKTHLQFCQAKTDSQSPSVMFNFGCCYHILDPDKDVQLSKQGQLSRSMNLGITSHALTLATRGHHQICYQDFLYKKKVKFYRYGLHLFLCEQLGLKNFVTVGDGNKRDYNGDFSDYAMKKIQLLFPNQYDHFPKDKIQQFYGLFETQKTLKQMFLCDIIRWQFGRVIEIYLLLDRCLFLQENGQEVCLQEFFDPNISPRNIGITAFCKKKK